MMITFGMFSFNRIVDLIVIDEALEALALRAILESFGVEVRCRFVGNANILVTLLGRENQLQDLVILSCHGKKEGMLLPDLAPRLEAQMPYQKIVTAKHFLEFLELNGQIVMTTGCCLGQRKFADSFLQRGAAAYIGTEEYVDGASTALFMTSFLYYFTYKGQSLEEAFKKAKAQDQETALFRLHQRSR